MERRNLALLCAGVVCFWLFALAFGTAEGRGVAVQAELPTAAPAAVEDVPVVDAAAQPQLSLNCRAAILVDQDTGTVLYEKNADEQVPIASITKVMTLLLTFEAIHNGQLTLETTVPVSEHAYHMGGSQIWLEPGEQFTLDEMIKAICVSSANDAAVAVAELVGGSEPAFVERMNARAAELGMEHTHFENPNGLNDEGHYSTAADMAALARVVMEHEALAKIVGTRSITVAGRTLTNHNKLLWRYEGCTGLKTGYTDRAGRTLVSCAERDGQRLIAVTLNDPNDWADHAALFDYGFAHYRSAMLALANRTFRMLPVTGSLNRFVPVYTASDVYYPLTEGELVKARVELPERVERVRSLNARLRTELANYPKVRINSPEAAVPQILNLSVKDVKGTVFQRELDAHGVCVSVKSACSSDGLPSRAVFAVSRDRRNALSSWRISLSHRTTDEEITGFLQAFDACYRTLTQP